MSKLIDLTGQRFGRLVALEHFRKDGRTYWRCRCDCGNETDVEASNLKKVTRSCGCLQKENQKKWGMNRQKHGLCKTRLYSVWVDMIKRCTKQNCSAYPYYGGRGIIVCEEWLSFEKFYKDAMALGYADDLTIDRIDVNDGYHFANVRFVPMAVQQSNKRNNHLISYKNQVKTLTQWATEIGIPVATLHSRLCSGWTIEEAMTTPVGGKRPNK